MFDDRIRESGPISPVATDGSSHRASSSPDFIRRIVSTGTLPDATQFTLTPDGARSTAKLRVNWKTAPFAES